VGRIAVLVGSRAVRRGGEGPEAPASLPASDRAAVALATRRPGAEVRAYCRSGDGVARRYALAAGAAGVWPVAGLEEAGFDLLLAGEAGAGAGGDLLLARIAERRGCALILEVVDVEERGGGFVVTRDLGRGARELLQVEGAAVLGVSAGAPRLGYVSHYRRQKAEPAPGGAGAPERRGASGAERRGDVEPEPEAGADLGSGPWEPVHPRARTGGLSARSGRPASERMLALLGVAGASGNAGESGGGEAGSGQRSLIEADAETCARHLLRYLAHHGFIERPPLQLPDRAEAPAGETGPASRGEPARGAPAAVHAADRSAPGAPPPLHPAGKLSRGPRPPGQEAPSRIRGPYGKPSHA
jgi:hypothetical protein